MDPVERHRVLFRWHPEWRTSLFAGLLLPLLLALGFWQLQRAEEKQQIARVWTQRQQQLPQPLPRPDAGPAALAYLRVELRGEYLQDRQFLLDNRMRQGRYGQEVLTPLRLADSGQLVLVNRGWVAGDPARRELPRVVTPTEMQRLHGTIYVPPGTPFTLGAEIDSGPWPRLLQALDVAAMSAMLGEPVYPYSVRLDADSTAVLVAVWPLLNTAPEKHRAYALQWFSMALVLLCLYLLRSSNLLAWLRQRGDHD